MKNHLVNDNNCNTVIHNPPKSLQRMSSNFGLTISVGDTTPQLRISIEQDN